MPKTRKKAKIKTNDNSKLPSNEPKNSGELELPDSDTIVSEVTFVSPKGRKYQIIRTTERDEYEVAEEKE